MFLVYQRGMTKYVIVKKIFLQLLHIPIHIIHVSVHSILSSHMIHLAMHSILSLHKIHRL